jgi:hypothetical protein
MWERKLRSTKATGQNLSDEENVSKGLKPLRFVAISPIKRGQKGRVIQVKNNGTYDQVDYDDDGRPPGDDQLENWSTATSGSESDGQWKGKDKVTQGEKERRHRLKIVKTLSATLRDLVRLLPRSGSPSVVSSIVGLKFSHFSHSFIFKKLTDAARQWGLDIKHMYDTEPQLLSVHVLRIWSDHALQVRRSSFIFYGAFLLNKMQRRFIDDLHKLRAALRKGDKRVFAELFDNIGILAVIIKKNGRK